MVKSNALSYYNKRNVTRWWWDGARFGDHYKISTGP